MISIKNNEINLFYKPKGITSFDLIRIIRKNSDIKKIGHAGTLDPNAEGLMILGAGTATKKLTGLIGLDKTYIAEIRLGKKTDSGDIDGHILEESDVRVMDIKEIKEMISNFSGTHRLPVSLYSAIKKAGKPLYKYAREGKDIEQPMRDMVVNNAKLIDLKHPVVTVEFNVSSGTYIRSLAEEIAKQLDTIGTLQNLKRTVIGDYHFKDSIAIPNDILREFLDNKKHR